MSRCSAFRLQPRSMNSTASQSSSSGCDGGSLCLPKFSVVLTRPVPKYPCHIRFTIARAVVGAWRSTSQRANVKRLGGRIGRQRIQKRRHARAPPPWPVSGNRRASGCASRGVFARNERQLGGSLRVLPPQIRNLRIGLPPLGDRCTPISEHGLHLGRCTLAARRGQNLAHRTRQRIGYDAWFGGDRKPECGPDCRCRLSSLFQPP